MKKIQIKGKDYVPVNERVMFFRTNPAYDGWQIITEIYSIDSEIVVIKASIINSDGVIMATGHGQENISSSFINKTSYVENCETSAVGRALGILGIGIDTSIASSEEVAKQNPDKKELTPKSDVWANAIEYLKKPESTIEGITSRYNVSDANIELLLNSAL